MKIQHYVMLSFAFTALTLSSCGGGESTETNDGKKDSIVKDTTAVTIPDKTEYTVEEKDFPATVYVISKGKVNFKDIGEFFGTQYEKIGAACGQSGHEIVGAPVGLFWEWNEETQFADMAAGMAVKPKGQIAYKDLEKFEIPASKCLLIAYYGAYEKTADAHATLENYMKEKSLNLNVVLEEYVTDPGAEPDTSKWLTNIYYILK